jgi:hypothetical protein
MFKKIVARCIVSAGLASVAVLFVGCADEENYTPQISGVVPEFHHSSGYSSSYTARPKTTYSSTYSSSSYKPYKPQSSYQSSSGLPYGWVPSHASERRWTAIVVHNSATDSGNMATIDAAHRAKGWDGVGYDFVIGNGSGSSNGQIEPTFRWTGQKTGAHCKTPSNWANESTIGICLIGNFNNTRPTSAQMAALNKLVKFLMKRYGITASKVYGHKEVPGHSTATDCPGRYFSMSAFRAGL